LNAGLLAVLGRTTGSAQEPNSRVRKFTMDLCPGRIGVDADQHQAIDYAARHGFESVEPSGSFLATLDPARRDKLLARLREAGQVWGAAGMPVEFRRDESTFQESLRALPRIARGLQLAGVSRVGTWISPSSDELTYLANFNQHVRRLKAIAKVLADHGLRFGLEYVGPKTSWSSRRFPFVHSMVETRELISEVGADNVGLVLDSWHWYTAGEEPAAIRSLANNDVVAVDLNDAPRGIPRDRQIDNRRELPTASGVIDLAGFLSALSAIRYDGPVRAEPFNRQLNDMDDEAAVRATADAMKQAFALLD
jgi:sugar phosphate isomerase/epimerase